MHGVGIFQKVFVLSFSNSKIFVSIALRISNVFVFLSYEIESVSRNEMIAVGAG